MEKTIEEYLSKLKELADQARIDGQEGVSIFVDKLISAENVENKIYKLILDYFDMLQDSDMAVYMLLLENGADARWYEFVEFLSDQRGKIIDYLPILYNCLVNQIDVDEMHDIEKNSKDIDEFRELADERIMKKVPPVANLKKTGTSEKTRIEQDFIEHLKSENAQLNERLNNAMDEVSGYRMEHKHMMETSISNKKASMDYKIEAEYLRKEITKIQSTLGMNEKKAEKYKEMIRQLNAINDRVIVEKSEVEESLSEIEAELDSVKDDYIHEKAENGILLKQIEALEQQLSNIRIINTKVSVIDEYVPVSTNSGMEDMELISKVDDFDLAILNQIDEMNVDIEETEELDYNPDDLISIQNNKKNVEKHSNFLSRFINRHFEWKFNKKSQAEQDNLIFVKLMENEFSKEMVQIVKKALRGNGVLSRLELYKLISNKADDADIVNVCEIVS